LAKRAVTNKPPAKRVQRRTNLDKAEILLEEVLDEVEPLSLAVQGLKARGPAIVKAVKAIEEFKRGGKDWSEASRADHRDAIERPATIERLLDAFSAHAIIVENEIVLLREVLWGVNDPPVVANPSFDRTNAKKPRKKAA
jgi:hypothetical protein